MTMKKILALLLSLALIFAFAACGDKDDDDDDGKSSKGKYSQNDAVASTDFDEDDLAGKYIAKVELEKFLDFESLASEQDIPEEHFEKFKDVYKGSYITYSFEFSKDGEFEFDVEDADTTKEEIVKSIFKKLYTDGLAAALGGVTQKEFEDALVEQGTTLKEFIEEFNDSLDEETVDDTAAELLGAEIDDIELSGSYTIKDGKITFTAEGAKDDLTIDITLNKKGFTITDDTMFDGDFKNVTFKKQ